MVALKPCLMDGGENTNAMDMDPNDPTGSTFCLGGDVEGLFTTSDKGDHWLPTMGGVYHQSWITIGCVAYSLLEPAGTVYACVGKQLSDSGFLVSTDGGQNWGMRSKDPSYQCNGAGARPDGPRPGGEGYDSDRSTGHLLAQDPGGGYLYTATYSGGVMRSASATPGANWTAIGLTAAGYYPRSIKLHPTDKTQLFVGTWDSDGTGTFGGVWHCSDARGVGTFSQFGSGLTATVSDVVILGNFVYALSTTDGLFRCPLGGGSWVKLNTPTDGSFTIDTGGSRWTSMDGYVNNAGNHVLVIACGNGMKPAGSTNFRNVVKVIVNPAGAVTSNQHIDMCANQNVDTHFIPPDNRTWWKYQGSWTYFLGGGGFRKPMVLIDQNNTSNVYVCGAGGFFRTSDGGNNWQTACNGMALNPVLDIAFDPDPNQPDHLLIAADDYNSIDMSDGIGFDKSTTDPSGIVPGDESHCVCFHPRTYKAYAGVNVKYDQNSGGDVQVANQNSPHTWSSLGLKAANSKGSAPIGIYADDDGSGNLYVVVATNGGGMWRYSGGNWNQTDTVCCGSSVPQRFQAPTSHNNGAVNGFVFDLGKGIYRSTDYGKSWQLVWAVAEKNDHRAGHLSVNPAVPGELWVTTSAGIWRLPNAGTNTWSSTNPPPKVTGGGAPSTPGGIAIDQNGKIYCLDLPTGSDPNTALMRSTDGGSTWQQADDGTAALQAPYPRDVYINQGNGWLYIANDYNLFSYSKMSGGGTTAVALSDKAASGAGDFQVTGLNAPRLRERAGAADSLNVTQPASVSPALADAAAAGAETLAMAAGQQTALDEAAGSIDGLAHTVAGVVITGLWQVPASAAGSLTGFVVTTAIETSAGVQSGQTFQLYSGGVLVQGQIFTIDSV